MLLKMSKNKSLNVSQNKVNNKQVVPVEKYEFTETTARVGVNKDVDHRSYAQVVRESCQKSVTHSSNITEQGIGVN